MLRVYLKIILICFVFISCKKEIQNNVVDISNEELHLANGVLYYNDIPFTGKVLSYHDQSKLKSESLYKDGRKHGNERQWYLNGKLNESRYYLKGKKTGIHKAWWRNGNVKFEYHFNTNGEYHGVVKEWYEDGQILLDFNYNGGKESGRQRMWKFDGSIKANYEVVNGERFGLIGLKKCYQVTVGSSEVKPNAM